MDFFTMAAADLNIDRKIYVKFNVPQLTNKVDSASIFVVINETEAFWRIDTDLTSFEVMHGLSRIALLVPDKLAVAIAINRENHNDPSQNGAFLSSLITELILNFRTRIVKQTEKFAEQATDNTITIIEQLETESRNETSLDELTNFSNLLQVTDLILSQLTLFREQLDQRDHQQLELTALKITGAANQLLDVSNIYLDFVHPICLSILRYKVINSEKINQLRLKINSKLADNLNQLHYQFLNFNQFKAEL